MSPQVQDNPLDAEIKAKVPEDLQSYLPQRDGAAVLMQKLPEVYNANEIVSSSEAQRVWELIGLYYFNRPKRRDAEALGIFIGHYNHMLEGQEAISKWALCEDAIRESGTISPESTGVYIRLVWRLGMVDVVIKKYAEETFQWVTANPTESLILKWCFYI